MLGVRHPPPPSGCLQTNKPIRTQLSPGKLTTRDNGFMLPNPFFQTSVLFEILKVKYDSVQVVTYSAVF